jgi:hypothetical protein
MEDFEIKLARIEPRPHFRADALFSVRVAMACGRSTETNLARCNSFMRRSLHRHPTGPARARGPRVIWSMRADLYALNRHTT